MHRKASKTRILIKMLREIQNLNMFTQNMSARDFSKDKKTYYACISAINLISQATQQLPKEFKKEHDNISWSGFKNLRNRLTHDYYGVSNKQVWDLIKKTLPNIEKVALDHVTTHGHKTCQELIQEKKLDSQYLPYLNELKQQEDILIMQENTVKNTKNSLIERNEENKENKEDKENKKEQNHDEYD